MTDAAIRVLVVDDSLFMREMIRCLLETDPAIKVVAMAEDAATARRLIKEHDPDVMTLDVEMPSMSGIDFLEKVMQLRPMPVVMVSTLTKRGADISIRALEIGALDVVAKPSANAREMSALKAELIAKVKAASGARVGVVRTPVKPTRPAVKAQASQVKLIAIGSSTGGIEALTFLLGSLPDGLPPIVITQHIPEHFALSMANRLNRHSALTVLPARSGQPLRRGHAYLATGPDHLVVTRSGVELACGHVSGERVSGHRPSVDMLFRSVAQQAGAKAVGIILTGMGQDGAEGMLAMHQAGAHTLGQNEASCVVYGMPMQAKKLGAVERELPLEQMPEAILSLC